MPVSRRSWAAYLPGICGLLPFVAQTCHAAHWQEVGPPDSAAPGLAYVDVDSVRQEGGYRVALFLTLYGDVEPNAHNIRLDRITQETAFDCSNRKFSLLTTTGYFQGKAVGGSSDHGNWRESFKPIPLDAYSQHAYELVCKSPVAKQPEVAATPEDSPGSVKLPGPRPSPEVTPGAAAAPADPKAPKPQTPQH
jgi:hypothetical protein